ncbi:DNA polymerase III subunit delta [Pusillimonas sp. CC-YST705]|uniref:DNA polymerase III subunit delta n=1 Tax=Mesopusillimonas faecipullorum TaxID=2755040 RepID=A0ABS8C917_9BURK|nr:DNA polymerase III subunit delta [Mesopusillimonas faecipullorum]MCB5362516.1 DNA polymerase III subunit delta [Mesopusillimonas faecipullorum]
MGRRLSLSDLNRQLAAQPASLDPLYVLSGDEPLLLTEAADSLRSAASAAGFSQRTSLMLDARSDWSAVLAATQNISLFGDQTLLDLKLPSGKPGRTGGDTLVQLASLLESGAIAHTRVVLTLPRLDKATRTSKWCAALLNIASLVEIPTIERAALPEWIGQRLARQKQTLGRDSLEWMADKVEGNLLAAHQEIMKLGLLYAEGALTHEQVEQAVLDVARYDVNTLRQAMLDGQARRALTVLDGLRAEGEALPLVLWAVTEELRALAQLAHAQAKRGDIAALLRQLRVFGPREALLRQAVGKAPAGLWSTALLHAHDIDRLIKGLPTTGRLNDAWEELTRLVARIAVVCSARRSPRPSR